MIVYQLFATGPMLHLEGRHTICSQKVFRSYEAAEAYREEFVQRCITPFDEKDLLVLE